MFKIEDKPVKTNVGKVKMAMDAISKMDIGQSFVYPAKNTPSALYGQAKALGRKVSIASEGKGKWRVHRVA